MHVTRAIAVTVAAAAIAAVVSIARPTAQSPVRALVQGMDVVRKIQRAPNTDAQCLTPPIKILKAARIP